MGLQFTYCECGCHAHIAKFGNHCFGIFNDLHKRLPFTLSDGHLSYLSTKIGQYRTFRDAEVEANKMARKILRDMKSQLRSKKSKRAKY